MKLASVRRSCNALVYCVASAKADSVYRPPNTDIMSNNSAKTTCMEYRFIRLLVIVTA